METVQAADLTPAIEEPKAPEIPRIKTGRKVETIEVEDAKGTVQRVTLVEMDGTHRDAWLNKISKATKVDGKGNRTTDFTGLNASLICACAYIDRSPIPMNVVQSWGSTAQEIIFKMCQKMNGLDKDSIEDEKKS